MPGTNINCDAYLLSFAQQRLWFVEQLVPNTAQNNIGLQYRVYGDLDVAALQWAVDRVVRRHEVLRSCFGTVNGVPVQVVTDEARAEVSVVDTDDVDRCVRDIARHPFDLTHAPLLRVAIVRSAQEHALLFVIHHIVADGWSIGILTQEIAALYKKHTEDPHKPHTGDQNAGLPELPIQYVDYSIWQREWIDSGAVTNQREVWLKELTGAPLLLELPGDRPRPAIQTFAGSHVEFQIPAQLRKQMESLAAEHDATLFMALLSAFFVLLNRWSGQNDILIGSPVANRTQIETESLIGFFANTLALRGELKENPPFTTLLKQIRNRCVTAFANQDLPFEQLVEALSPERSLAHNPLVQVMFILQNTPGQKLALPGVELETVEVNTGTSKFDLTLSITPAPDGELKGIAEYSTDLFDRITIKRLTRHYLRLLHEITTDPERPVSQLPLLDEAERTWLLLAGRGPELTPSPAQVPQRIWHLAQQNPDAPAVTATDGTRTRGELITAATTIAAALRKHGVGRGHMVGLCLPRDTNMLTALLGIWAAGGAYVPLNADHPAERLAWIAQDANLTALLTTHSLTNRIPPTPHIPTITLDELETHTVEPETHTETGSGSQPLPAPDDAAYVIYTSGSTGHPKGVVVEHRNLTNLLDSFAATPGFGTGDRMLGLTPLSFDIATLELLLPLITGGELVIAPAGTSADPEQLHTLLNRHGITHAQATPATWKLYTQHTTTPPPTLRQIWCGGEELPPHLAERLLTLQVEIHNLYGPTETTIWSTQHRITTTETTIGRPIANTQVYILDQHGELAPAGVPGQLCIAGAGVTRGYLHRPHLTSATFTPDPFTPGQRLYHTGDLARWNNDSTLRFLGRTDHQIKIRGHRIELGEIDTILRNHPHVHDTITTIHTDTTGEKQLISYVIPTKNTPPKTTELRQALAAYLPAYMIPTAFVTIPEFPLTANGKIDHKNLPEPNIRTNSTGEKPATNTEKAIAAIWRQLLKISEISRTDNFFELGGNSLHLIQLISRLRVELHAEVALCDLFTRPILCAMAELIGAGEANMERGEAPRSRIRRIERGRHRRLGKITPD